MCMRVGSCMYVYAYLARRRTEIARRGHLRSLSEVLSGSLFDSRQTTAHARGELLYWCDLDPLRAGSLMKGFDTCHRPLVINCEIISITIRRVIELLPASTEPLRACTQNVKFLKYRDLGLP
jgi:hypothetical protein